MAKQAAKDLVAEKKAKLLALIAPPKTAEQLEAEAAAKAEAEKELKVPVKKAEAVVAEAEAPPEGDLPEVIESEEEQLFDENYHLDEEVQEYNSVEKIFKQHNIPYDEEKLKAAIIWNNRVHPDKEKKVDYAQGRYPDGLSQVLMINPFKEEKKKKGKKKKKWASEVLGIVEIHWNQIKWWIICFEIE